MPFKVCCYLIASISVCSVSICIFLMFCCRIIRKEFKHLLWVNNVPMYLFKCTFWKGTRPNDRFCNFLFWECVHVSVHLFFSTFKCELINIRYRCQSCNFFLSERAILLHIFWPDIQSGGGVNAFRPVRVDRFHRKSLSVLLAQTMIFFLA